MRLTLSLLAAALLALASAGTEDDSELLPPVKIEVGGAIGKIPEEEYAERATELRERLTRLRDEIARVQEIQARYRSQYQSHGYVWLFRRKPAKKD